MLAIKAWREPNSEMNERQDSESLGFPRRPGLYPWPEQKAPPVELSLIMLFPAELLQPAFPLFDRHRDDVFLRHSYSTGAGVWIDGREVAKASVYGPRKACSEVCRRLLEHLNRVSHKVNESRTPRKPREPITLRLLVPFELWQKVFGSNDLHLKKIMNKTKARIQISEFPDARKCVIVVEGTVEQMSEAEKQLNSRLHRCYKRDLREFYQTILGDGEPDSASLPRWIFHAQLPRGVRRPQLPPPLFGLRPSNYCSSLPFMGFGSGCIWHYSYRKPFGRVDVVHVWVPSCALEALTGRDGSSIQEIVRLSGCRIEVSPNQTDTETEESNGLTDKVESFVPSTHNGRRDAVATRSRSSVTTEETQPMKRKRSTVTCLPDSSRYRRVTLRGFPSSQWLAQALVYSKEFLEAAERGDLSSDVANDPQFHQRHLTVEVNVPTSLVGQINEANDSMVDDHGKRIPVIMTLPDGPSGRARSRNETAETPLYITGTFFAVQSAQGNIRGVFDETIHRQQLSESANNQMIYGLVKTNPQLALSLGIPPRFFGPPDERNE